MKTLLLCAAPLLAAPLLAQPIPAAADPVVKGSRFDWFLLTETPAEIQKALGQPAMVADFGADFQSWQFQIGDIDHHDFSHQVVFRKSINAVISVVRNYEPEVLVDQMFPPRLTSVHHFPDAAKPQLSLRLRQLPGDRVLMAIGSAQPGQPTNQIVLMRRSELPVFYGWLAKQLESAGPPPAH